MKLIDSISKLINDYKKLLDWDGALFVNHKQWDLSPKDTFFLYLEGDEELENLVDDNLPVLAVEKNVQYFLDAETFIDIIEFQKKLNKKSDVDDYIIALNYYLEEDDFYEP